MQRPAGAPSEGRAAALLSSNDTGARMRGLRGPGEKLIVYPGGERPAGLYDLRDDPGELSNRTGEAPQRVDELRALLDAFDVGTPMSADGAAPIELAPEAREQLEALGYID